MIIDAHQHFWRYVAQRDTWITPEMVVLKRDYMPPDLEPKLLANGVDGTVAVQVSQSEQETFFLLELAERNRRIAGVVGWVDLCDQGVTDRLRYFSQFRKLRGFRHIVQSEPDDRFLLREDFCRGIAKLREFDFTYDILIYSKHLQAALEFVRKFPEQRFVIDHLAKPPVRTGQLPPWADQMAQIADHANTWCKLSGLVTEADWGKWNCEQIRPYIEAALQVFGPDRLMFGSDWPVCLLSASYAQVLQLVRDAIAHLPTEQQQKILGLNAISFYGLRDFDHGSPASK